MYDIRVLDKPLLFSGTAHDPTYTLIFQGEDLGNSQVGAVNDHGPLTTDAVQAVLPRLNPTWRAHILAGHFIEQINN